MTPKQLKKRRRDKKARKIVNEKQNGRGHGGLGLAKWRKEMLAQGTLDKKRDTSHPNEIDLNMVKTK